MPQPVRPEVVAAFEAVFDGGHLVRRARLLELLLSWLDPPPEGLQWIDPLQLSRHAYQDSRTWRPPSPYSISVRYPDGRVATQIYLREGARAREIVLTPDEAFELLQACLAELMREISGVRTL